MPTGVNQYPKGQYVVMGVRQTILIMCLLEGLSGWATGQPYVIRGNIEHAAQGKVSLASFYGDRFRIADSIESSGGSFHFILPEDTPAGIYRLFYSDEYQGVRTENKFVEFIYNREPITMNVAMGAYGPIPSFEHSTENRVYFEFMTFQMDYEAQLIEAFDQLFPALPGDPRYESAVTCYERLQSDRIRFMDSITFLYPGLYATKIMNAFRAPVVPGSMSHGERIDTLKQLFFEGATIDDPTLLHAPVYTFRIVDYLSLYRVDTLSRALQEREFIKAADRIMANVAPVQELRSFVLDFMLEGFELLGMEQVEVYLADHYLDESCESDVAELVRARMEGYRKMAEGSTAPDFLIRDVHGMGHRLSGLPNPYVLVMFWASTCGHCTELIPELHEWYMNENDLNVEVVAIAIDTAVTSFEEYAANREMQWITAHDPLGWHGKIPTDYHIYATPSLFLLDRERTILSKPVSFKQFRKAIRSLGY